MLSSLPPTGMPKRPPRVPRPAPVPRVDSPRLATLARRLEACGQEAAGAEGAAAEAVAEFWREVAAVGAPLIEQDPQGDPEHAVVTFVWRGSQDTRAVLVLPNKVIDPREPDRNLMDRLPGTDIWHWSVRMRRDWRATYALCVDEPDAEQAPPPAASHRGGPPPAGGRPAPADAAGPADPGYIAWLRGQGRPDPLNPRALPRRWGGAQQSVVRLPLAPSEADWQVRDGIPRGAVSSHPVRSAALGTERRVWVYTPAGRPAAGAAPGPDAAPGAGARADLPVLVLFDGEMWQPELGVATLLDNLIADGRLPPLIALLPDSLDSDTRWSELACNDRFVRFLSDELLPWAAARWPVTDDPARTVLAGQSLGGLMAAYAAVRAPHRFGNALAQSGSFWWPDGPQGQWLTSLLEAAPEHPAHPVRFWLSAGEQEWVLLPANRRLPAVLRTKGYEAEYREFNGGHDYLCWRTELADGLTALLAECIAAPAAGQAAAPAAGYTAAPAAGYTAAPAAGGTSGATAGRADAPVSPPAG
ncbi:enterochelin esterase [Streptomyces zagrosensis]|uniref:Enterochelin esterase family protein n=1 Tax=Streptomyces zagrosensis TaxID=1042984 RepID=A0A7W9V0L5_9ACTN|nr:enterochelin esterase [Streptomyces zagrosensis]MBB5937396.1 enterochelin esterase family protein [Streptomyces zagrosensis]